MFDRLSDLVSEHAELEHALADPAVHSDQEKARTLGRRYAELTPIVHAYHEWQQTSADEGAARELSREDSAFADEADQFARHREELEAQLQKLLVPRDPNDDRDVILEVKAGEGGVHRVQRVPVTESQGRIHTSAAGVLVAPEAAPV